MFGRPPLDRLAFGRVPAYRKYELFFERYRAAAEFLDPRLRAARGLGALHRHSVLDHGL